MVGGKRVLPFLVLSLPLFLACQPGEGTPEDEAQQVADSQGPFLLVVNKSSSTLSLVDPKTGTAVGTFETGFGPHEVAVSRDGRFAYVTDYGTGNQPGSTLTVVDLQFLAVDRTISLAPHTRPHGVAVASDGTLWITTEGSAHVLHVDPEAGEILEAFETGQRVTHMVEIAEAAGRVVTANIGSGTATIVDPASGSVVHVETGAGSEGLAVHPDGRRAFVTNRSSGTLVEVDLATGTVTRSMNVGEFPIRVKVRPGGNELLISNSRGNEVVAVDPVSWEVVRRLPVGSAPIGILVTPDDKVAYVANTADDKLTIIDLENWEVVGNVMTGDEPDGMAWVE